ncbi:MFS transporter [Gordonibacter sp.]|uniref:MFS transporter n=1 Tax=Gordonibacter sp. TaxID=1968902 RepID=UPI002FC8D805
MKAMQSTSNAGRRTRGGIQSLIGLSLAGFFMYGCNNILMTLLPSYALSLGATMMEAGLQSTVFLVAAIVMRFYFGPLADRRGARFVMVAGAASFALSSVLLVLSSTFWQLLAIRVIQAVGLSAFWPCAVAAVASIAPTGKSGLFIGCYRFATAASLLFGPLVALILVKESGYAACFAILAVGAAAALVLSLRFAPTKDPATRSAGETPPYRKDGKPQTIETLRMTLVCGQRSLYALLAITAVMSLGYGLSMNFVVTFVEEVGAPINAGLFFSFFSIGGLVANPLAGWIADTCNRRHLLATTIACMGLGIGMIALVQTEPLMLLAAGLVAGLGSSGSTIVVLSAISAKMDERYRASALALQQNAVDLGIACASTLFGWLFATACAPETVFAGQAVCMVASAAVLLAAKRTVHL